MFKEIICALTLLVTLNYGTHHIQRLIQQTAELEEQVLFLTVKLGELRELNTKLQAQNQDFRYEAAAAQRTLAMQKEPTRKYFTRTEWEVGSEAWQALSEEEKDRILRMTERLS
jgi:cell division protein FtsB